jgi:zinc protease
MLAVVALLHPLPGAAQDFPKTPPAPAPVRPAPFPPFQEATLPNGLRLLVVENRKEPVVSVSLSFAAGSVLDPAGKEGLAGMTASLLTKGAGKRTADQFAEAIESTGGSLGAGAGADFLTVSANVMTPSLPLAFELMADAVMRPTFPEAEVELLRTQTLSGLQVQLSQPGALADIALQKALYGNHPYSRSPVPASVRAITRADIAAFHRAQVRPSGALMVVAGDVSLAAARRLAVQAFRGWLGTPPAAPAAKAPAARTASEIVLVHRPGSVQSNILAGNLTTPPGDPRAYAAAVANRILGGGSDSRLFSILREQKGWTYGAYSGLSRRRGVGSFTASAEVRTEVTDSALVELLAQVRRMGAEVTPEADLEAAKGSLVGSYPLSIETAEQVAGAVANARLYGLGADYVQNYRVRLSEVTAAQVQATAKDLMRADAAAIVVVGDGAKIYDRIKGIAPTRIVDPEGKALTPADLVAKAAALPFDVKALAAKADSFGIMVQGNQLGAMTASLERTADGFRYVETTNIAAFVQQRTEVSADAALAPREVKQVGKIQGQETSIDVVFSGGRAKGTAITPDPEKPGTLKSVAIDTTWAAEQLEENLVQAVLPALPWKDGAKWTFSVFSSASGETRQQTLAVTARETVTVPAGSDEAWKIELTGGQQVVHFWVSVAAPHKLMKLAIAGTPIEMQRIR